jgi:glycosyltransferase involved in cell wall biosynthesis
MDRLRQFDAPECRVTAQLFEIKVFDFLSYDHVHLPFNEGYLRILRAAYPRDRISFSAAKGHIEQLAPRIADLANITFRPCKTFETWFGLSHHNPLGGRLAARQCKDFIANETAGRRVRLITLLGFNAHLLVVMGRRWPAVSSAPLHMVLHGQLGEAMVWRSRNPIIRAADLISQLKRPLPRSVAIVALELGTKEAIVDIFPTISPSIVTLEHPILRSEWAKNSSLAGVGKLKIGFVGHARRGKGFDVFLELASTCPREDIEFQAIGHSSPETDHLDFRRLARKPSKMPLPRKEYLEALQDIDLVCLPLHSRAYDSTGSGTVSDAVAALKPIIVFRNRTIEAIFARYGSIGWLVDSRDDLFELICNLNPIAFARRHAGWVENLRAIREARRPEALAKSYATSINMTGESQPNTIPDMTQRQ